MKQKSIVQISWFIMTLFLSLAALTNHSLGDVVYKKVRTLDQVSPKPLTELGEWQKEGQFDQERELRVLSIRSQNDAFILEISGGLEAGLLPGTILQSQRLISPSQRQSTRKIVPTSILKVIQVGDGYSLAKILEDGSLDSAHFFPRYPGVMVEDRVIVQELKIQPVLKILPEISLVYQDLFVDPKQLPTSFELLEEGRLKVIEAARELVASRSEMLLIEGHTGPEGDSQSNQVESYQRAMTIRQVLIEAYQLDPDRVLALGLGEGEPLDEPYLPGKQEEARRIILKVKKISQ